VKPVAEVNVWWGENRVGVLSAHEGRLGFEYLATWIESSKARSLSQSLPLRAEPFGEREARPFFAGLLPEGQVRRLIAQQLQVSDANDFALLEALGGECAGALTFGRSGESEVDTPSQAEVRWLTEREVADLLEKLPTNPLMAGEEGLRLSLAGAQDKLPVVFDGERIGLPLHGTASSHILKPSIQSLEDTVYNEAFCMALAGAMNLEPAPTHIRSAMGTSFLLVERYDRFQNEDGERLRVHQEDLCQALGVVPEVKYQNEGGPSFPRCFDVIRQATRPSAPNVLRLFDYAVFNALVGNHDAHAKNFSLLYIDDHSVLAPLYDVVCTAVYPNLTDKMAMKVGNKYQFADLYVRHWQDFAHSAGLSAAQAKKRIRRFATELPHVAQSVVDERGDAFAGRPIVSKILTLIENRCAMTVSRVQ